MTIKAVYERGVFRPTERVELAEGSRVEMEIVPLRGPAPGGADPREVAGFLKRLAAMPLEPGGKEFSNRDHDRILYGWTDKP